MSCAVCPVLLTMFVSQLQQIKPNCKVEEIMQVKIFNNIELIFSLFHLPNSLTD